MPSQIHAPRRFLYRFRYISALAHMSAATGAVEEDLMQSDLSAHREAQRCPRCRLVQFRTAAGTCRRCGGPLGKPHLAARSQSSQSSQPDLSGMTVAQQIGITIRRLRKERKLSQQQLAAAMGTARPYISRLERGLVDPSLQTLDRAAFALGVGLADLLLALRSSLLE